MKTKPLLSALIGAAFALPALGMYIQPEIKDLPLERILTNLTAKATAEDADANTLHLLARTHGMAYAQKIGDADEVKAWSGWRGKDPAQPWFGFEPAYVPFSKVAETEDAEKADAAKAHLAAAIDTYKKALAAEPDERTENTIKLGLAWCLDQADEDEEAATLYKEVAEKAWEKESKQGGGLGNFLYIETIGYLIPLMDAEKDAEVIAEMDERKKTLLALPRAITPLVIPVGESDELNALIDHGARVTFDLDGTGRESEWPWITKDAAWLVFDPTNSGKITSSIQMFGSRSFLLFCNDGYEALTLLDDNHDGTLAGRELTGLALWNDKNSDGISDPGEVKPVGEHGITSLSTAGQKHTSGMPYAPAGVTFENGTTRPTYDLILESK